MNEQRTTTIVAALALEILLFEGASMIYNHYYFQIRKQNKTKKLKRTFVSKHWSHF